MITRTVCEGNRKGFVDGVSLFTTIADPELILSMEEVGVGWNTSETGRSDPEPCFSSLAAYWEGNVKAILILCHTARHADLTGMSVAQAKEFSSSKEVNIQHSLRIINLNREKNMAVQERKPKSNQECRSMNFRTFGE